MVFIGGLHRSGTTHLAQLLGQHPDASIMTGTGVMMDEGQYLQDLYPQDWQTGGPGCFAFSPAAHQTEHDSAGNRADLRRRLMQQWAPYWDLSRPVLVEKTPGNLLSSRFLQSLFPDEAHFVFITRHPVAVSLATRKWSRTSLFALFDHWLAAHQIMRQDLPHLRRAISVSYEDLVADPAGTVAEILAFLGMAPMDVPVATTRDLNARYFADWTAHYARGGAAGRVQRVQSGAATRASWGKRLLWTLRAGIRKHVLLRRGIDLIGMHQEALAVLARHEARVRGFGYSLVDLVQRPACVKTSLVRAPEPMLAPAAEREAVLTPS